MVSDREVEIYIESELSSRLSQYLEEVYGLKSEVNGKFCVIRIRENVLKDIMKIFWEDDVIIRYINRIFLLDKKTNDLKEIVQEASKYFPLRVQAYPKELQLKLLKILEEKGVNLSPTKFKYILYVFAENNSYFYGIFPARYFFRKKEISTDTVSSAYYKIKEAVVRFKIPILKDWIVLDLGAAPGGWTQYLSERVRKVVAVDPAELLIKGKNIVHIKKKFEDSFEEIEKHSPFDLITCDINQDPREVAQNLVKASRFLRNGGYILMTIKLIYKSKKAKEELINETVNILSESYKILGVKWLLANSRNERCLCGFYMVSE